MADFPLLVQKVVSSLPSVLTPHTIYLVRVGHGFDLYVTDSTGQIAHKINDIKSPEWQILSTQQNLNDMKTEGRYFINTTSNLNAPTTAWIYVEVERVDINETTNRIRQKVWADNNVRAVYHRIWNGTAWTAWETTATIQGLAGTTAGVNDLLMANKIITSGKLLYPDVNFKQGMNGVAPYGNIGGSVIHERIEKRPNNPTSSTHEIRITRRAGLTSSPSLGGFYQLIQSSPNKVFIVRYLICLPVGYSLVIATNATGNGRIDKFIGSVAGTGKYESYYRYIQCGDTGSFSTSGHVYVHGTAPTTSDLVWYLAQIECYEATDYKPFDDVEVEKLIKKWTYIEDVRNDNQPPHWYWTNHPRRVINEFKAQNAIGLNGLEFPNFVDLETRVTWSDATGGNIIQTAHHSTDPKKTAMRYSTGTGTSATWTAWVQPFANMLTEQRVIELINANKQFNTHQEKLLKDYVLMNTDSDNDTISDYDEINKYNTSPTDPDSDNDEWTDAEEIRRGTDPNAPNPRPNALFLMDNSLNTISKNTANDSLIVVAKLDINNKTIEPIVITIENENANHRFERTINNLMYSGDKQTTITIPVKDWYNEQYPNNGLTGSQYFRVFGNSAISGYSVFGTGEHFTF